MNNKDDWWYKIVGKVLEFMTYAPIHIVGFINQLFFIAYYYLHNIVKNICLQ